MTQTLTIQSANGTEHPAAAGVDWALGPGAVSWEVMRNPCVFVVGILREAILLTLHPPFAAAAVDHDGVHEDPARRFRTIAQYAYSATYGTKADAEYVSKFVRRRHKRVVGTEPMSGEHYRAHSDYELVLTQVLLSSSFLAAYEAINPPLSREHKNQYLAEQKVAGALLGIRPEHLPSTVEEQEEFLRNARELWAAGNQARQILRPFASGVYPPGSVIGSLPPLKRKGVAAIVRALTDTAMLTMAPEDLELLSIDRAPQLRSRRAVRASLTLLARYLGSDKGSAVFDGFVKDRVAAIYHRALEVERTAGGFAVANATYTPPDATPFVADLDDRVENMPDWTR